MNGAHPAFAMFQPFLAAQAVDLTAFIGQWPSRLQSAAGVRDLTAMADRMNLQALCVSHIASIFGHDTRSGNEALLAETKADERLWPFVILNPAEPSWDTELAWAAASGARGVRLVPGYHEYSLRGAQTAQLIEQLKQLRLPLHVCVRLQDERLQHRRFRAETPPFHELAELVRATQGLPMVLSGLRASEWESVEAHLNADDRTDHVLCDLWFTNGPIGVIASLCNQGLAGRFAYGSCVPIQTAEATALQLAAAAISEADRQALCRDNALRLLGGKA